MRNKINFLFFTIVQNNICQHLNQNVVSVSFLDETPPLQPEECVSYIQEIGKSLYDERGMGRLEIFSPFRSWQLVSS